MEKIIIDNRDPLRRKRVKSLKKKIQKLKKKSTKNKILLFFELGKELEKEYMRGHKNDKVIV